MIRTSFVIAAGLALAVTLPAISAQAAARDRVFVASYGSDSNPCTFGSPCKTFQFAIDNVAVGGEVTAIDSAGFGPIVISHAVTITSPNGVEAGIAAASGGDAIDINAGSGDTVSLHGLTLNGAGIGGRGIVFNSGAALEVVDCNISNYTGAGIFVGPLASASLTVSNTAISDVPAQSGGAGIYIVALSNTAINIVFDHVSFDRDYYGIALTAEGGLTTGVISNSRIDNSKYGFYATAANSQNTEVLEKVTFSENVYDIYLDGRSIVYLSQVTGNPFDAVSITSTDEIFSDGTNHLQFGGTIGTWQSQ